MHEEQIELMKKMSDLNERQRKEAGQLTNEVSSLTTQFTADKASLKDDESSMYTENAARVEQLGNCDKKAFEMSNQLDGLISKNIQQNVNSVANVQETVRSGLKSDMAAFETIDKQANGDHEDMVIYLEGYTKKINRSFIEHRSCLDFTSAAMNAAYEEMKVKNDECTEATIVSRDELIQEINVIKIDFKRSEKQIVSEISSRVADVDALAKSQIVKDVPTGQTPQKTNFSYPSDLVHTSPHELIIERYRAQVDNSMTTLTESLCEMGLESDSSSVVSSKSVSLENLSNSENQAPASKMRPKMSKSRSKLGSNSSLSKALNENSKQSAGATKKTHKPPTALQAKTENC